MPFKSFLICQLAKWNVEKYYSVVGVMEEEELSLKLFEKYLPRYFSNIFEFYTNKDEENIKENEHKMANLNPLSKSVTNATRKHLLQSPVFKLEYEFYEFIKQRLHIQARYCGFE